MRENQNQRKIKENLESIIYYSQTEKTILEIPKKN